MIERLSVRTAAILIAATGIALAAIGFTEHRIAGGWILLDQPAAVLLAVNAVVGAVSVWLSPNYLDSSERTAFVGGGRRWYYAGLFVFWMALLAVPIATNLGIAWLLLEMTTAASAFLVAYSGRRRALEAGWKYLVLTTAGLTVALLGVLYLEAVISPSEGAFSALDWAAITSAAGHVPATATVVAAALILVGLASKIGWAPVHHWLPDAHSEAPAPVSALLSSGLLPTVMLVAWRVRMALAGTAGAVLSDRLFIGLGLASLAVAAPFLWRPMPVKRLLAYSSLEHMGILALGLSFQSPIALVGVALHVLGHATAKSLGFYSTIPLHHLQPTAVRRPASGVMRLNPGVGSALGLSLASLMGLPPSPLFFSELLIFAGGLAAGQYAVVAVAVLFLALGFVGLAHQMIEALAGRPRRLAQIRSGIK